MMRKFTLLALLVLIAGTLNTTAQTMRLSAVHQSYYILSQGGWAPFDSVVFMYPSNNGGTTDDFDLQQVKADTSFYREYVSGNYPPDRMVVKTFDFQGNTTSATTYEYNSPNFEPATKVTYSFDVNNNPVEDLTESHNGTTWENSYRTTRTFDVNNNMLSNISESWNTTWTNTYQSVYTYDVSNNIITQKNLNWNSGNSAWDSTSYHHYYYTGNLQDSVYLHNWNSGWNAYQRYYLQYDVNNANTYRLYQNWDVNTSSWVNSLQSFVTFSNNLVDVDTTMTWIANTSSWEYMYRYGYHYNNDGNALSYYYQEWDITNAVFVNNTLDSCEYNGLYKTKRQSYSWDANTNTYGAVDYSSIALYYYEPYTADVKSLQSNAGTLNIYPVPTRNHLNVDMKWNEAQDFTIAIYDMQGRLISQTGEKATKDFKKSIPLNDLASGTYILKIRGKEATVTERFVIID